MKVKIKQISELKAIQNDNDNLIREQKQLQEILHKWREYNKAFNEGFMCAKLIYKTT